MSRKVLVIGYYFPPLGGAGVQRLLKFVKYLPEHGYLAVIVSTKATDYPAKDPTLLSEIPRGTPIVRARDFATLRWAAVGFDFLKLKRLRALAAWPDDAAAWIPAATASALRAVGRHRPSVILSSAPPFSAHLVAWATARATGIPWVADFRDEFAANPQAEGRTDAVQRVTTRLERRIVADAARVVVVADYYAVQSAPPGSSRRVTIVNGVDPADVVDLPWSRQPSKFRISFVGTLYADLDLAPVTSALGRLAARRVIDPSRCELRLVGSMWLREKPDAGEVPVLATGYVDHQEALAQMHEASVLLFYLPDVSRTSPGKIFEYLACERPVLCVARRDSLSHKLVDDWGAGRSAEPSDTAAIESAITELYRHWECGTLRSPEGVCSKVLEHYSRRRLTGKLAEVLDGAIASGAAECNTTRR